jgi:hypothetical protein
MSEHQPLIAARALTAACLASGGSVEAVEKHNRGRPQADAVAIAAWILVKAHGLSLPVTGRLLGRHHTTVLHALKRVKLDERLQFLLDDTLAILEAFTRINDNRLGRD